MKGRSILRKVFREKSSMAERDFKWNLIEVHPEALDWSCTNLVDFSRYACYSVKVLMYFKLRDIMFLFIHDN